MFPRWRAWCSGLQWWWPDGGRIVGVWVIVGLISFQHGSLARPVPGEDRHRRTHLHCTHTHTPAPLLPALLHPPVTSSGQHRPAVPPSRRQSSSAHQHVLSLHLRQRVCVYTPRCRRRLISVVMHYLATPPPARPSFPAWPFPLKP